ncbi:urease accessory protein UreD [Arthrobacter sp. Sa2BUA2]|uniref:Urease accessory protein UreD n=1 Tax=Arthrobacter pullicola TaxID=2762224 RepID=A0ABR8YG94_9MICC|nr:urease accessory protein UreD [Arthrobacter pullicola]MBD8043243.1 urease accessory protein UreD [Arthrobacter pullicola]
MTRSPALSTVTDPVRGAMDGRPRPTRIAVERTGPGARFSVLDQGLYLAPRPVSVPLRASGGGNPRLRVALIGIHMMLLGGDDVRIEVTVGPGVTLELIEPAGMVAYDAEGVASRWSLDAVLGEGSTLVWDGAPFVVAGGSNVLRETRVRLDAGARVLLRETLVLGRSGEAGGALRSVTRLAGPSGDFLYEDLDLTGTRRQAIGVLGASKVLASATAAGWRPSPEQGASPEQGTSPEQEASPEQGPGTGEAPNAGLDRNAAQGTTGQGTAGPAAHRFDLAADGAVLRALADSAHQADRLVQAEYSRWKDQLTE